jgi:hypothetical protein
MVPGLEQRLMNSPEEELVLVADLVRFVHPRVSSNPDLMVGRSRGARRAQGRMIPRASRVQSSTGSRRKDILLTPL